MATTPIETWAVDLADVTAIYPWNGSEVVMEWVAIVLWVVWHVWQVRHETATYDEELKKYGDPETIRNAGSGD